MPAHLSSISLSGNQSSVVRAMHALGGIGLTLFVVQGLSFVANLLVVRALSVTEYAILTTSFSVLGMLVGLADSGLSAAAMTMGGKHQASEDERSQVLRRCRSLILQTGLAASLVVVPVWFFMVQRLGGAAGEIALTGVVLFGGFFVALGLNVFRSFLFLEGRRVMLQKMEAIKTVVRVAFLVVGLSYLPNAAFVIACGAVVEVGAWWFCRRSLANLLVKNEPISDQVKSEISRVVWRLMPTSIYRAFSSQLFLLLLVTFGATSSVAGAGALARFVLFYTFVGSLSATIFAPRLARSMGPVARLRKLVTYTVCGWLAAVCVCACVMALAGPILSLFGEPYANLTTELRFFMLAACLASMNGVLVGLLNARGWIIPPALVISVDIVFSVLAILLCDVSTLWGFISMTFIVNSAGLLGSLIWAGTCIGTKRREDTDA